MRFPMLSYIDPGAGNLLLQFILASIVGVFVYFRNAVRRLFSFLFGKRAEPDPAASEQKREPGDRN